jgi:hypothetical protein
MKSLTYLLVLVILLLALPAAAQYRLAVVARDIDPQSEADNIFVRIEIPEELEYWDNYRLEVTLKGPWKINMGHDFFSPQNCTGKEVLCNDSGFLPWWGDVFDPTFHYFATWNGRIDLKKLPWEQCTLNAIAYREVGDGDWDIVAVKTVKVESGHKHRILFTGGTETGWYDDPARVVFQTGVLLVTIYGAAEVAASVLTERKAFESFGCKPLAKRIVAAIEKEALKLAPAGVGHFMLRVTGASQWKCRTRTYEYCCYHGNQPDTWVIDYETIPQVFHYDAQLIEQRYLITVKRGSSERKATLCQGFLSEEDINGAAYYNSGCLEPTDVELPTIMWTDVAKNKRYIHWLWLNHVDGCAGYIRPCEREDQPSYGEGF